MVLGPDFLLYASYFTHLTYASYFTLLTFCIRLNSYFTLLTLRFLLYASDLLLT